MAMDKSVLGAALWNRVKSTQSFAPALTSDQDAAGLALWTDIADELINHIKANAVVTVTSAVATGVTSGPSTAPVTGTGVVSA